MPDVGRSDSQRSDSSQRPRVSFNRDVHIKRIGRSEGGVVAALTSDGEGHLVATPVRRERGQRSRSELAKEAALVLKQADQVRSIPAVPPGGIPSSYNSLDRSKFRKRKTPVQQIFLNDGKNHEANEKFHTGRRLTRSVSDVTKGSLRRKEKDKDERNDIQDRKADENKLSIFATLDRRLRKNRKGNENIQKQLSPILEDENNKANPFTFAPKIVIEPPTPIDERFNAKNEPSFENTNYKTNKYNDSKRLLKETVRSSPKTIDETEESGHDSNSLVSGQESNDIKGTDKKRKQSSKKHISRSRSDVDRYQFFDEKSYNDNVSVVSAQDSREKRKDVKRIVRELSQRDTKRISPPKTTINALVDPTTDTDRQHNMNRPFSYIHPNKPPTDQDQVIYAQVVCSGGDKANEQVTKRTIHTSVDRQINTGIEEDESEETNMKANDSSILDHLSMRRDRLESRLDSHKKRFQQNLLTTTNKNVNNENRYIVQNDISAVDNLGSITDLSTKERYFEHHIKTTALFRHKEFLSDSPSPTALNEKQREHHSSIEYDYKPQRSKKQQEQKQHKLREHREHHEYVEHREDPEHSDDHQNQQQQHQRHHHHHHQSQQQQKQEIKVGKKSKDVRKKTTKMEKVRQLVSWNKKNKSQSTDEETDPVKARYIEYKGTDNSDDQTKDAEHYANRRRPATPVKNDSTWFKSLTRKSKQKERKASPVPEDDEFVYPPDKQYTSKSLRFFGDSDKESTQSNITAHHQVRSSRIRPPPDSSAESTLEDESGHSQKSVVYLHAAAVGDIPGSKKIHRSQLSNGRRALSREELSVSNGSTAFVPHSRTLSRSISVLAPWRPRHPRDGIEINYNNAGKPPRAPVKTTTKTPSKPEKKKQKEATLGRRGSDESKKSGSIYSQESTSSSRRNQQQYGVDTVDSSNRNSIHRKLKKINSDTDLSKSTPVHGESRTSGWFRSRK